MILDVEGPIRQMLREMDDLKPIFGNPVRGFFATPRDDKGKITVSPPWFTVARIGGTVDLYLPEDRPIILHEVWAGIKAKGQAAKAAYFLASVISDTSRFPIQLGLLIIHGANILDLRWRPDPDSDRACYTIQARYTCLAKA